MINIGDIKNIIKDLHIKMDTVTDEINYIKKEIKENDDNTITSDDIIISIKLRLAELDLDIFDYKKKYIETMDDKNEYNSGYIYGKFESLSKEYRILKNIMSDYYNGIDSKWM